MKDTTNNVPDKPEVSPAVLPGLGFRQRPNSPDSADRKDGPPAHILDLLGRGNELVQNRVTKPLLEQGLLTQLVLLDGAKDNSKGAGSGIKSTADKLQDNLLELLVGQTVVKKKEGQSSEDALREAKTELAKMLADLKAERDQHILGPATKAAFERFEELYKQRAFQKDRGLSVSFEEASSERGFEKFQKQASVSTEVNRRAMEVQNQLISTLPAFVNVEKQEGEKQPDYEKRRTQIIEARADEIRREQEQGLWGPKSQGAFKQYQTWFHEQGMPGLMTALDSHALRWPVGCPEQLKIGSSERAENPEIFRALLEAGKRVSKSDLDPASALEDKQFKQLRAENKWFIDASELLFQTVVKPQNEILRGRIASEHLPDKWLQGADEDPRRWRAAAAEAINLNAQVRNLVEAMDALHRDNPQFPFVPPKGTEFLCKDGQWRVAPRPDQIERNKPEDTITAYRLKLPQNLRFEDTASLEDHMELVRWANRHGENIIDGVLAYRGGVAKPLSFADIEVHGKRARINANGEFVGICDPKEPVTETGETRREFNLLSTRCLVKVATDGPNKGKEVVVQSVDVYDIPPYGYQNTFGKRIASQQEETLLSKDKYYGVLSGGKVELVKGDKLASTLANQAAWLRTEQVASPTIDALLLVFTFGEGFAARKAAQTTGEVAAKLTAAEINRERAKFILRLGMVGAGVLNSAGGRDSEIGRTVNQVRGIYFLCDIGLGVGKGAGLLKTPAAAEKLKEAVKASRWLHVMDRTSDVGFTGVAGYCSVLIGPELSKLGQRALGLNQRRALEDADFILGDGVRIKSPEKDSFDMRKRDVLAFERTVLDRYLAGLQEGRDPNSASQKDVKRIIETTQKLMDPEAKPEDVERFKKKMLAHFVLKPEVMQGFLERLTYRQGRNETSRLTDADLREFHDPQKLMQRWRENGVNAAVAKRNAEVGPDVRAAAAMALLTLSRRSDGSVPAELAADTISYSVGGKGTQRTWQYKTGISFNELTGYLKRDMGLPDQHSRGIVTGELLLRYGNISGKAYAANLLRVLEDPNANSGDRMRALTDPIAPRMATIIDSLKVLERADGDKPIGGQPDWKGFGLSSKALTDALRNMAWREVNNDADRDVRAMATMLLYGLAHPDPKRKAAVLEENNNDWQYLENEKSGTYAYEVQQYLTRVCDVELPKAAGEGASAAEIQEANKKIDLGRATRLNAALHLWELCDKDDKEQQAKLAQTRASCFSPTDASLSVKVLEALIPDRIGLLQEKEALELKKKAVELLSTPETIKGVRAVSAEQEEKAAAMVKLVQLIPKLLGDKQPELTKRFAAKLEQMIDPREAWKGSVELYNTQPPKDMVRIKLPGELAPANLFPELQAEAIKVLSEQLGAQSAVPLIRSKLTGQIQLRGETFEVDTSQPLVRLAAATALSKLNDGSLRQYLPTLIAEEGDPAVAQALRDIQLRFPPLKAPDRAELCQRAIEEATREYLRQTPPSEADGEAYLRETKTKEGTLTYGLLDGSAYKTAALKADASQANSVIGELFDWNDTATVKRREAVAKVFQERMKQWDSLVETAKKAHSDNDDTPAKAKAALAYALNHDGAFFSAATETGKRDRLLDGSDEPLTGQGKRWQRRAAEALVDVLKTGEDKQQTAYVIETAMKSSSIDPETKLILLKGLRWMYEKSDLTTKGMQEGIGEPKVPGGKLAFSREYISRVLDEVLSFERRESNRRTGSERSSSEKLRKELISDFVEFGDSKHRREILLVTANHDPSEDIRKLARSKFYETQDGLESTWKAIPDNKAPNPQIGVERVTKAYIEWKGVREIWQQQLAEFKKLNESEASSWLPEVADKRDALALAILSGFKGCKFDGQRRIADAQGLALLALIMDDPDNKIRLAAAKVLTESELAITHPAKRKALKVCCDIFATTDNPEYKKEAETQLKRIKLDKPVEDYLKAIGALQVGEQREACSLLRTIAKLCPDEDIQKRAGSIEAKFWEQNCKDVIDGKIFVPAKSLSDNDPLLPLLKTAFEDKTRAEGERLNAAKVWFLASHQVESSDDFNNPLLLLKEMAKKSKDANICSEATVLMVQCLDSEWSKTPDTKDKGYWDAMARQDVLVRALVEIDHPAVREILKKAVFKHPDLLTRLKAEKSLIATTASDIVTGLNGTLNKDTQIKFDPITESNDPRTYAFYFSKSEDKSARVAQLYALVAKESTGVPDLYKSLAAGQLAELAIAGDQEVQRKTKWVFAHLDPKLTPDAVRELRELANREVNKVKDKERPTEEQTRNVKALLETMLASCRNSHLEGTTPDSVEMTINLMRRSPFKDTPAIKEIVEQLAKLRTTSSAQEGK